MIISTWNVNSISVRLPQLIEWLQTHKPSVVCLQETKTVDEKFPLQQLSEIGYNCDFYGERSYNGVAILSDRPIMNVRKGFIDGDADSQRRLIEADVDSVHIINVYIPNGSAVGSSKYEFKMNWLEKLRQHIQHNHDMTKQLVLCGDFNIATEDKDCYNAELVKGTIMVSDAERESLNKIKSLGFVDTFRINNQESGEYSWWDYRMGCFRRNMGFRIDHVWASESLAARCDSVFIDKAPRKKERPSDHAPVVATFN
ncbi:exodeoxyribonuclease III [soil metagenome]